MNGAEEFWHEHAAGNYAYCTGYLLSLMSSVTHDEGRLDAIERIFALMKAEPKDKP